MPTAQTLSHWSPHCASGWRACRRASTGTHRSPSVRMASCCDPRFATLTRSTETHHFRMPNAQRTSHPKGPVQARCTMTPS